MNTAPESYWAGATTDWQTSFCRMTMNQFVKLLYLVLSQRRMNEVTGKRRFDNLSLDKMQFDKLAHYHLAETRLKTCSQNARVKPDFYEKCHLAK